MEPIRIIYEDTPDAIPVPAAFRHGRSEIIIWPLPADTAQTDAGKSLSPEQNAKRKRPVARLLGPIPPTRRSRMPGSARGRLTLVAEDDEHLKDFGDYMP